MLDILLVRFHSESVEKRCLETLQKFTAGPYKLIDIDNSTENRPLTDVWDDFIRASAEEFVTIINPDVLFAPGWDTRCLAALARDPVLAAVTPAATGWTNRNQIVATKTPPVLTDQHLIDTAAQQAAREDQHIVHGAVTAYVYVLRRAAYLKVGGFDRKNFPFYGQECDLNVRLQKAGYRVGVARDAYVHHFGRVSTMEAARLKLLDPKKAYDEAQAKLAEKWPGVKR